MPTTTAVTPGLTFRSVIADGNALWEVIAPAGDDVWHCEVVPEPDGGPADYVGTSDVFYTESILRSVRTDEFLQRHVETTRQAAGRLAVGQTIHVAIDDNAFYRGTVVEEDGDKLLRVDAIVGELRQVDRPRRLDDGTISTPYTAAKVGETVRFRVDATWESDAMANRDRHTDPATLDAVDLTLPPMTDAERAEAGKVRLLEAIRETAYERRQLGSDAALDRIRELLAAAPPDVDPAG